MTNAAGTIQARPTQRRKAVKAKKISDKKPFTLSVGGWKFYVDHAYKGQEKLARHQAEVMKDALSKDAIDAAMRTALASTPSTL